MRVALTGVRRSSRQSAVIAALLLAGGAGAEAQEPFPQRVGGDRPAVQDTKPGAPGRDRPSGYLRPLAEAIGFNGLVWAFDRFIMDQEWAKVGPDTWAENFKNGWQFDDNAFQTNQLAHPYHGGMFFSGARASGYDFWSSVPTAFFGSWTWEYLAETYQPSFNDWINTSVGGVALGEITWRLSEALLDDRTRGGNRFWRELGATAVSPLRGLNRLIDGKLTHTNPDYQPIRPKIVATATAGARSIGDPSDYSNADVQPVLRLRLDYGDDSAPFDGRPFDAFSIRLQLNGQDKQKLGLVEASGRLWASRQERGGFSVRQFFVYDNYEAYELGAQSVMGDWDHNYPAGNGRFGIKAGLVLTLLGAVKAENVLLPPLEEAYRDYDYGPGAGVRLGAGYHSPDGVNADVTWGINYLHAINGSSGEHVLQRFEGDLSIPVWKGLQVNGGATWFFRHSKYDLSGDETIKAKNLEFRLGIGTEF
jgi:hypothetical protein